MTQSFDYAVAFGRNIGWVSEAEQARLRLSRVAIAGMGGVGGFHVQTLTRLGVGAFHLSDLDQFEIANFNRQAGASMETLGQPKVDVMAAAARAINPEVDIQIFPDGVSADNLEVFLEGVDLYIDGLDFFVLDIRRKIFARCRELGIPAITAAPLGMGSAYLVFTPDGMSFEDYFRLEGLPPERQYVNFALGLAPKGFHRRYLDGAYVDFAEKRGPSTVMACQICAGVAATEALKLLLGRGNVKAAPCYHHFDPYRSRWKRGRLIGGNANPLQRLKLEMAYRIVKSMPKASRRVEPEPSSSDDIETILHEARWAPSGDNTQPWRFRRTGADTVDVRVVPPGDIYDFNNGQPTLLSAGFLLETMRLAASGLGRACQWTYKGRQGDSHVISVDLSSDPSVVPDPLRFFIRGRSVVRGAMRQDALTDGMKAALLAVLPDNLRVQWFETAAERRRVAGLNAMSSDIRLRLKSAFDVHRRIIDWEHRFSEAGIPGAALGLDPLTQRITRYLMGDWRKMDFMNRYLGGTVLARLQMDLIPGRRCAAHFLVSVKEGKAGDLSPTQLLDIGAAMQRFWLTATRLGLAMQPGLAVLCFAHHGRQGEGLVEAPRLQAKAERLAAALDALSGDGGAVVFAGRLGRPKSFVTRSRSLRRRMPDLVEQDI